MNRITGRSAFLALLKDEGITHLFGNPGTTAGDPEALAPAPDIGRVGRAVGTPARRRMIMPCPARGDIDLEANASAQAFASCDAG